MLIIENSGEEPITVGSNLVSVQLEHVSQSGEVLIKEIPVQSYSDLIMEVELEEAKQRRAAAWAAAAGAINASTAAYSTSTTYQQGNTYGNFNSNTYGNYGYKPLNLNTYGNYSGSYSGTSTTTTYDPAKAQALANQNEQNYRSNLASISSQSNSSRQMIERFVMKDQTVLPGAAHGGLIVTDTRNLNHRMVGDFYVVVTIDGEQHKFKLNRSLYLENKK